jgi:hypothetical protein
MKKINLLILGLLLFGNAAFAIDQVTLKSGEIVQGKVLSEEANLHVDIETTDGTKKRFAMSDVASVDRDVPSNLDHDMVGADDRVYFGLLGGGSYVITSSGTNNNVIFDYGARFGVTTGRVGSFSRFAFGLSYDRVSQSVGNQDSSENDFYAQFLFTKVANSGFYFGPELGLSIRSSGVDGTSISGTASSFGFGALAGYDYYFNNGFSMGPELHLDHLSASTINYGGVSVAAPAVTNFKFLLTATLHFQ